MNDIDLLAATHSLDDITQAYCLARVFEDFCGDPTPHHTTMTTAINAYSLVTNPLAFWQQENR